eukprot:3745287-Prymnesium_polylepis.1
MSIYVQRWTCAVSKSVSSRAVTGGCEKRAGRNFPGDYQREAYQKDPMKSPETLSLAASMQIE